MTASNKAKSVDPMISAVEIIKDRLYYTALKMDPTASQRAVKAICGRNITYFSIDSELAYWNFFLDFGPLNLGQLYRFSMKLNSLLRKKKEDVVCFYSASLSFKRANAIYLICCWQLLYLNRTPEEAYKGFKSIHTRNDGTSIDVDGDTPMRESSSSKSQNKNVSVAPKQVRSLTTGSLPPFHDASPCVCTYDLTILDCLRGLAKARMYGFFDFKTFNVREYEHYEQVENGDLNWIIKDRILAFAGPQAKRKVTSEGYCALTPEDYLPYFQRKNVKLVVRLNKKCYDEHVFVRKGIRHLDQYYLDGSCPPMQILQAVLKAFEQVAPNEAFAVHCKAGLGRTGTCIGAYLMKHYKFTAAEAIAWMRICRPGCVIGPQQHFLQDIEQRMWHEGNVMKLKPKQQALAVDAREDKDEEEKDNHDKKKQKDGSPKSVTTTHFDAFDTSNRSLPPKPESVVGRPDQGDSLLAARRGKDSVSRRLF